MIKAGMRKGGTSIREIMPKSWEITTLSWEIRQTVIFLACRRKLCNILVVIYLVRSERLGNPRIHLEKWRWAFSYLPTWNFSRDPLPWENKFFAPALPKFR